MPGQQKGFTLIELMVTIAIAAILVTIGVPSFTHFMQENRMSSQVNRLVGAFHSARSNAVLQKEPIVVCPSTDQQSCNGGAWAKGWIVFVDADGNAKPDKIEDILQVFNGINDATTLSANNLASNHITYDAKGIAQSSGYFKFCDDRGKNQAQAVVINATGTVRSVALEKYDNQLGCP